MTIISQKRIKDPREWDRASWVEQEKLSWFTLPPPSSPPPSSKESRDFGFLSSPDEDTEEVFLSQPFVTANPFPQQRRTPPLARPARKTKTLPFPSLVSYKNNWLDKELFFAMNKLSITAMVVGLMFLGALFFMSGFLLALNLYVLSSDKIPAVAASFVTPHRPSSTPLSTTHSPTPKSPPATVPQHYANVGGVAMVNPPHRPTQMPVQLQPQQQVPQSPPPYYQSQPVYQPQPSAPAPYPDVRYGQQQPAAPVQSPYETGPQYQPTYPPAYPPPYQPAPGQ